MAKKKSPEKKDAGNKPAEAPAAASAPGAKPVANKAPEAKKEAPKAPAAPAPAVKPVEAPKAEVKPAVKPVEAPKAPAAPAAAVKPVEAPKPQLATPAEKPVAHAPVAPAAKPVAATSKTTIVAKVNVGWGNSLYMRGEGGGLSWDVGIRMECTKDDEWTYTVSNAKTPLTFKFLRNDDVWSIGENVIAAPGSTVVCTPAFER